MKLLFTSFVICLGLIVPGSNLLTAASAQNRAARTRGVQPQSSKRPIGQKNITARLQTAKTNAVAGDPCTEAVPINFGQTISGTLAATDCVLDDGSYADFYAFTATGGQQITISQNSSVFDTFLALLDVDGNLIDVNDDDVTGTNSRLPPGNAVFTIPFTGTYLIAANSYDPATSGAYTVTLNNSTACATTTVTGGQTVNGTLASSDCRVGFGGGEFYTDRFAFSGTAGQQISIALNSTAFDAYLVLYQPTGNPLEDDNSGGGTNARVPATGTYTLPATGTYYIEVSSFNELEVGAYTLVVTGGTVTPTVRVRFDYDGDARADLSVFRPSNGFWYRLGSTTGATTGVQFGQNNDLIAPADYDGDGRTDLAVFRPSNGTWYRTLSSNQTVLATQFGQAGDVPAAADYDGDARADLAVFRPSTGTWYILNSTTSAQVGTQFGQSGDRAQVGDFDGDGRSDLAVFRPSNGTWYINRSTAGFLSQQFGLSSDVADPADYDGDGRADLAVFRPSNGIWYRLSSMGGATVATQFGQSGDVAAAADYDGDGRADLAVFRPSTGIWYVQRSTQGFQSQQFGQQNDVPTPAAYGQQ